MTTDVKVEQIDRDVAADLYLVQLGSEDGFAKRIRDGINRPQCNAWETAFARHRLAERAAIVAWLRGEVNTDYTDPQYDIGQNLADAIEQGQHHDG